MTPADLARLVCQVRKQHGLTMRQLARKAGVNLTTIRDLESGEGNPTWETMCKIARVLPLRVMVISTSSTQIH